MIVILDDDPTTVAQLASALDRYASQLRRNGGHLAPDLLILMRSLEARSGQARPELARPRRGAHAGPRSTRNDDGSEASDLLTYAQAGERLGFSVRTVRRRVADGSLPVVRLGPRACRIPAAAVAELASGPRLAA